MKNLRNDEEGYNTISRDDKVSPSPRFRLCDKMSKLVYLSSGEEFGSTHGGCMAFIGID